MKRLERDDYPAQWEEATDGMDVDWFARLEELEEPGERIYAAHGMTDDGCTINIFRVGADGFLMYAASNNSTWDVIATLLSHFAHHQVSEATISLSDIASQMGVSQWPTD